MGKKAAIASREKVVGGNFSLIFEKVFGNMLAQSRRESA